MKPAPHPDLLFGGGPRGAGGVRSRHHRRTAAQIAGPGRNGRPGAGVGRDLLVAGPGLDLSDQYRRLDRPPHSAGLCLADFSAVRHGVQWFSFQWPLALPVLALLLAQGWLFFRLKAAEGQPVRPVLIRLFLVLGVAVFFGSELSYPLWTVESPLLRIQLPYRFLSVAYVMVIVIGALLIEATQASGRSGWRRGMAFAIAAVGVLGLFIAGKSNYLDGGPLVPAMANDQYTFELLPQWSRTPDGGFACSAETRACRFLPLSAGSFPWHPRVRDQAAEAGLHRLCGGRFCAGVPFPSGPLRSGSLRGQYGGVVDRHVLRRESETTRLPVAQLERSGGSAASSRPS